MGRRGASRESGASHLVATVVGSEGVELLPTATQEREG